MQRSKRTNKTTHRSEWRSLLKKDLTGPTLLEMSGFGVYQELPTQPLCSVYLKAKCTVNKITPNFCSCKAQEVLCDENFDVDFFEVVLVSIRSLANLSCV
jgi:hypothetical protein